jgi:hypothetical protein
MQWKLHRFPLMIALTAILCAAVSAGQKAGQATSNPPASPQAKTSQPATHFTQGTITSIQTNQLVISRMVRGKAAQMTFVLNPQTERTGSLVAGARVSVQYREANNQNVAAAVRELPADSAAKTGKTPLKPKSKS